MEFGKLRNAGRLSIFLMAVVLFTHGTVKPAEAWTYNQDVTINGKLGVGTETPGAKLQLNTGDAATKGLVIKAATSQSVNLLEIQNGDGNVITSFQKDGTFSSSPANSAKGMNVEASWTNLSSSYEGNKVALRFNGMWKDTVNSGYTIQGVNGLVGYAGLTSYGSMIANNNQIYFGTQVAGTHHLGDLVGAQFELRRQSLNTQNINVDSYTGFKTIWTADSGSGTISITTARGALFQNSPYFTITNFRGIEIQNHNKGQHNTNLLIGEGTTGNWSIYNNSEYKNYFAGNVSIGTTSPDPAAKLHVAGDVKVDGNIAAKYQDLAEYVKTTEPLPSGTVVMIDPKEVNQVLPSDKAYTTLVAGVVSNAPGIILGEEGADKAMIAHTGRVKVKVDTSYGEITVGDLLVTSPVKGHAMKADSDKLKPGMLLGKALEPLAGGQQGEILTLITLQ